MELNKPKEFNKCPNCKHNEPFFKRLGEKLKAKGYATPTYDFSLDMKMGPVIDEKTWPKVPYGAEVPGFMFVTDICENCGTVYARAIMEASGKKSLDIPIPGGPRRVTGLGPIGKG